MGKQAVQLCPTCSELSLKTIVAAKAGHLPCLRAAYDSSPAALNERDHFGATPLHYAARHGHLECLRWLCEQSGVSASAAARNGATPAHDAAATGHVECLRYLLESEKLDVNDKTNEGATVFHLACRFGRTRVVKFLLETRKVSVADKGANNVTGVHIAAAKDNISCVKVLTRQKDYVPNVEASNGATPVYFAAQEGSLRCLRWLIERSHGDPLKRAADGMAPIHAAASSGHLDCLKYLVEKVGISGRMPSTEGATPLHHAAGGGQLACVEWLLNRMQDKVLDRDKSGGTPIHDAAELGQAEVIRLFMKRGFNLKLKDDEGLTPYELAKENGCEECMKLLSGVSARRNDLDLRNPGAAIRKAAEAARKRMSRSHSTSSALEEGTVLKESANNTIKSSTSDHKTLHEHPEDVVDGPEVVPAVELNDKEQPSADNEVFDPTLQLVSETVLSDDEDVDFPQAESRHRMGRNKSLINFFTGLRRRISTTSLSSSSSPPSSPPPTNTASDAQDQPRKGRKSKLSQLKSLWSSRRASKGSDAAPAHVRKQQGPLPAVNESEDEQEDKPVSDKELQVLEDAEALENALPDIGLCVKKSHASKEKEKERKQREFEAMMFGKPANYEDEASFPDKPGGEFQSPAEDPKKKLAQQIAAETSMPQYLDEEEDDLLVKAMEQGLEETNEKDFNYDADGEDELELLEQESEVAKLESEAAQVDGAALQEATMPSADTSTEPDRDSLTKATKETDGASITSLENEKTVDASADGEGQVIAGSVEQCAGVPADTTTASVDLNQPHVVQDHETVLVSDSGLGVTQTTDETLSPPTEGSNDMMETAKNDHPDAQEDALAGKECKQPDSAAEDFTSVSAILEEQPTDMPGSVVDAVPLDEAPLDVVPLDEVLGITAESSHKEQRDNPDTTDTGGAPTAHDEQEPFPPSAQENITAENVEKTVSNLVTVLSDAELLEQQDSPTSSLPEQHRQPLVETVQVQPDELVTELPAQTGDIELMQGPSETGGTTVNLVVEVNDLDLEAAQMLSGVGTQDKPDIEEKPLVEPETDLTKPTTEGDAANADTQLTAVLLLTNNSKEKQAEEPSQEQVMEPDAEMGEKTTKTATSDKDGGVKEDKVLTSEIANKVADMETHTEAVAESVKTQPNDLTSENPSTAVTVNGEKQGEANEEEPSKDVDIVGAESKPSAQPADTNVQTHVECDNPADMSESMIPAMRSVTNDHGVPSGDEPMKVSETNDALNSAKPSVLVLPPNTDASTLPARTTIQDQMESENLAQLSSEVYSPVSEGSTAAVNVASKVHMEQQEAPRVFDEKPVEQPAEVVPRPGAGRRARRAQRASKRIDSLISDDYLESISDANLHNQKQASEAAS